MEEAFRDQSPRAVWLGRTRETERNVEALANARSAMEHRDIGRESQGGDGTNMKPSELEIVRGLNCEPKDRDMRSC